MTACGPQASTRSAQLAATVGEAAQVAAGRRGARGRARSPPPRARRGPRRSSSASRRRSPSRRGKTAARARAVRRRCPESGSRGVEPAAQRGSAARDAVFARPRPPPDAAANAATARSASDSTSGRRSPRRSASQSRSGPGSSCRSASVSAWPLPRRGEPDHAGAGRLGALGGRVARAVVGDDDRAVRELLAERLDRRADPLLLVPRRDENRQPIAEPVAHPCAGSGRDRRQHAVVGRLADAVAPGLAAGEEEHEPEPAGRGVDRVDGREARRARTRGWRSGRARAPRCRRPAHPSARARRRGRRGMPSSALLRLAPSGRRRRHRQAASPSPRAPGR